MIKLTITNADDSPYWVEYFESQEAAHAWLTEEQTRLYWDATRVAAFEQLPEQRISDAQRAAEAARAYLTSTDWYVVRQLETGAAIPADIAAARAAARLVL